MACFLFSEDPSGCFEEDGPFGLLCNADKRGRGGRY